VGGRELRLGQPDRKSFREVFVGMRLRVPVGQMADEAADVRARRVGLRSILGFGTVKNTMPFPAPRELSGMIDGVSAFVTEQHHAPFGRSAFHFHHLAQFQRLEQVMSEIERDGARGHALR
jgi:hypothetical protein